MENKDTTPKIDSLKPKDELRNKFANTFKLFDDEGPTMPVEVTNVGKLKFNIEDLDPNKANKTDKFDIHEEETKPVEVTNVGKLKFNIADLDPNKTEPIRNEDTVPPSKEKDIASKFNDLEFTMKSKLDTEQKKDELTNSNTTKHYKVLKFFTRLAATIFDQAIILGLTFLYFIFLIKPTMIEIPYKYIEGVTYFIIKDSSNFKSLIIAYILISLIYYTTFNILIKSTPFNYLFGYKIYKNNTPASIPILITRNLLMIPLNFILLLPFLFMIVSDDKQTIYDKIFQTYFLKES